MAANQPAGAAGSVKYVRPGHSALNARTMRTSGPQQFDTELLPTTAGQVNVQKNLPLLQPLAHIMIRLKLRLGVTVSITDCPPEAPFNLFSLIKVFGTHTVLGSEFPWQLTGEMAAKLPALLDNGKLGITPLKINTTYYSLQQLVSGVITPTFFTSGGSPYDIEAWWCLPCYPFGSLDYNAMQYLWDARSWGQTMQVNFQTRDASATGAFGTTGTKTITAFGSGSGNPTIDILLDYANLGPALDASLAKAVVVRNAQFISSLLTTAAGPNTRLLLLQNKKTNNVLVKTGTIETGSNNVYATLSDGILEQTALQKVTTPVRNTQFNDVSDFFYQFRGARPHCNGYFLLGLTDGEPSNNPHAALRADQWAPATQFNLVSQVIGPAATNIGEAMQEYVDGEPVIATAAAGQTTAGTSPASAS